MPTISEPIDTSFSTMRQHFIAGRIGEATFRVSLRMLGPAWAGHRRGSEPGQDGETMTPKQQDQHRERQERENRVRKETPKESEPKVDGSASRAES